MMLGCGVAAAQVVPAAMHGSGVAVRGDSDVPDPVRMGFSANVATTAAHDSLSGWSLEETPSISYRFSSMFSADASFPFYAYLNAVKTGKKGDPRLVGHQGVPSDAAIAGHVELHPELMDYDGTLSFSLPTGNEHLGVGTGHVGVNYNNHLERNFGVLTPDLEIGIGNSSGLVRRRTAKSYSSSGMLGFLQAGSNVALPGSFDLDAEAYEQLPLGAQSVYSRANRKKGAVLTRASDGEDNGFTFELDAPPLRRLALSANLSHSLRLGDTTEGLTLSFLLHAPGLR